MQASLDQQRTSVRAQAGSAVRAPEGSFFTIPWPAAPAFAAPSCDPLPAADLTPLIDSSAAKHGLKPELIRAVITQESAGRPCAVSARGAQGLMQIMPATAEDLQLSDPLDPKQNVDAGSRYLKSLLDRFGGDLARALGAYNAGPGAVEREGGVPPIDETQNYVAEILKALKQGPAASPPGSAGTSAQTTGP
jgi:soluble lytic murein transglycosylase-like protein